MKTIFTIAAIAMFAVTLGLGLMSSALAEKPDDNGKHKILLCHFQEEKPLIVDGVPVIIDDVPVMIPAEWALIDVDNKGKMNGHFDKNGETRHFDVVHTDGDFVITDEDEDVEAEKLQACLDLLPDEE